VAAFIEESRMLNVVSKAIPAGVAALLLGSLGTVAAAQDKPEDGEPRTIHEVIIKRADRNGDRIRIDGKELSELTAKCASDDKQEADVRSGEGKEKFRTRIIICGDGKADSAANRAKLAEALEKARTRLGEEDALSEKGKAQAIEALDREIARLRSGG